MKKISFSDIEIKNGFWKTKQDMVKNSTIDAVYNRFKDTHRFDALKCEWHEGEENMPHIFWDSDVAKWIEGVSYILEKGRDERLEKIIDDSIDLIVKNADEHGYFNSHFLVTRQNERFCHRDQHELYCAGHLIEAAVAYYHATGKDKLLKAMCKYADYIEQVFVKEKSAKFVTPGHPELELALIRLYDTTKDPRYLSLAKFFIDEHGKHQCDLDDYLNSYPDSTPLTNQDECPIKERSTAEGHAVRALYLMCGAADVGSHCNDSELIAACRRVFDNIATKRMYITGGVGSTYIGEAFTIDYDLPNRTAYAETCAAISLAMLAGRMQAIELDSKYADVVERVIYNGFLSGVSMNGKAFFYENPLEIDPAFNDVNASSTLKNRYPITERKEVFDCSCCPPNVVRFIPSIADYMYTYDDSTLYVHQYIDSETVCGDIKITQNTRYPENGSVKIKCSAGARRIALRIPGWCKSFKISAEYKLKNGYAFVDAADEIDIEFDMPITAVCANRHVHADAGRVAIMRGPVVYCAEGVDNVSDLKNVKIDINADFTLGDSRFLLPSVTVAAYQEPESELLYRPAADDYEKIKLKLIPYYAFANRGTSEMLVWFLTK